MPYEKQEKHSCSASVSARTLRSKGETGKAGGTSAEGASVECRRREFRAPYRREDRGSEGVGRGQGCPLSIRGGISPSP